MSRDAFFEHGEGVWRFWPLLPAFSVRATLGEGGTPIIRAGKLGERLGAHALYIKDESLNPTGSFKARGMAVAVSRLLDLGIQTAAVPSAGNAGLALAAYGAAVGLDCRIFIPSDAPEGVAEECRAYGALVEVVEGMLPEAARRMEEFLDGDCAGRLSTFREPCRVEGKKTMAFEVEGRFGGEGPEWILFPTGGGTGIVAIWKAYEELEELGWLRGPKPRLAAVQSTGCAPIVRAFLTGAERAEPWADPQTAASGIRVPASRADELILKALRESGGAAVAVPDEEIISAVWEIASAEGIFPSPEGAAAWAGLKILVHDGTIRHDAKILVFVTAGGARYRFLFDEARRRFRDGEERT
jgi:threonine synthase